MDSFAFIIHPIHPKRDVSRKYPLLGKFLTERQINFFSTFFPPVYISEIEGITSQATGKQIRGWFLACPLTPTRMMELPEKTVYRKIIETGRLAESLGAQILGLGAFTSVVGDAGITIAKELNIPVTTGDAYTVAIGVEALLKAAEKLHISLPHTSAAVVGATGAIGQVCAKKLAEKVPELYLIGRRTSALENLRDQIQSVTGSSNIHISTDVNDIKKARLILTVTSAIDTIIHPEHLQSGSIICDVARPRDVSARVAAVRKDVLVIDGGMVDIPGSVNFHFDFGFPPGKAYACMAETMALTLEGRFEDYTLGKDLRLDQVNEIETIANKHGFRLSGFRSFEKAVTDEDIKRVLQREY
ncbi:MAG: shikimate dehydrogenase [Anaerolineales bacterium]|nr:shikimate dehydrogenase [Anaerolineales bacterium]